MHSALDTRFQLSAACLTAALMCCCFTSPSFAVDDVSTKKQEALIYQRSELQKQIQNVQRSLRQVELDRNDKLEELEQLYRARAELAQRHSFNKSIDDAISEGAHALRLIESQRRDCLEELEALYQGLSQVNGDLANGKN